MNKEEAKKQIDADEASINGVKIITACRAKDIIDAIDDRPKVKLPREVGEELEDWLKTDNIDYILDDILCVYDGDHEVVRNWWCSMLGATYLIADMARYGWEAEPEELFYVEAPENWGTGLTFTWVTMKYGRFDLTNKEDAKTFTRAELKQYHLDSDIFTLVPLEDEK